MGHNKQIVLEHFSARAEHYDRSSRWVSDQEMGSEVARLLGLSPSHRLLDVACGTGLWALNFRGRVKECVGLDMTPDMFEQARARLDRFVEGSAEELPFDDDTFDRVTERQGIQFMNAPVAVSEMVRVTKVGGMVCLTQLCAYGEVDKDEYFAILALRNPARRNFFVRDDLVDLLTKAGCRQVETHRYISEEDVGQWADNGAIAVAKQQAIQRCYAEASDEFCRLHKVSGEPGVVLDHMLFIVAIGTK